MSSPRFPTSIRIYIAINGLEHRVVGCDHESQIGFPRPAVEHLVDGTNYVHEGERNTRVQLPVKYLNGTQNQAYGGNWQAEYTSVWPKALSYVHLKCS